MKAVAKIAKACALNPDEDSSSPAAVPGIHRRSLADTLAPLQQLIANSPNLIAAKPGAFFQAGGATYEFPRYIFVGPKGGGEPIRIGIFAGIHGDEPEGVHALIRFLTVLERKPELATGYCLFLYPICNPTGFENRTRLSASGKDLNREFWRDSSEPEVRILEQELLEHTFHGVIALHTDDTSDGFYGFAHGATLTRDLIEPAIAAAEEFLPRNSAAVIDGLHAQNGVIFEGYQGVLSAPPNRHPRPFEIILETPAAPPSHLKEAAMVAALKTILTRYSEFIAYASNI